jgi:hypothetical protein
MAQNRRVFRRSAAGAAFLAPSAGTLGCADVSVPKAKRGYMTLTLQDISDRLEIEDVLIRYCYAVDDRNWDLYRKIFTAEAIIDDTVTGGVRSGVEEHVAYLAKALSKIVISQHAISTMLIEIKGDEASVRTVGSVPMVVDLGPDKRHVFFQGLWYRNRLVRTRDGWKITELIEEGYWTHNLPVGFSF